MESAAPQPSINDILTRLYVLMIQQTTMVFWYSEQSKEQLMMNLYWYPYLCNKTLYRKYKDVTLYLVFIVRIDVPVIDFWNGYHTHIFQVTFTSDIGLDPGHSVLKHYAERVRQHFVTVNGDMFERSGIPNTLTSQEILYELYCNILYTRITDRRSLWKRHKTSLVWVSQMQQTLSNILITLK